MSGGRSFHGMTGDADLPGSSPRAGGEGEESVCQCQRQGGVVEQGRGEQRQNNQLTLSNVHSFNL